jgi:hypothetical protein
MLHQRQFHRNINCSYHSNITLSGDVNYYIIIISYYIKKPAIKAGLILYYI